MNDYDLMGDPEDELLASQLRKRADRLLLADEFAVAYEYPIDSDPDRGYLTAWVTDEHLNDADDPFYHREQGISGDDRMIRRLFSEMATQDIDRIVQFIAENEVPE